MIQKNFREGFIVLWVAQSSASKQSVGISVAVSGDQVRIAHEFTHQVTSGVATAMLQPPGERKTVQYNDNVLKTRILGAAQRTSALFLMFPSIRICPE